jgi:hypothetical protein
MLLKKDMTSMIFAMAARAITHAARYAAGVRAAR